MALLELKDVNVSFSFADGTSFYALQDMNLAVEQGELVALVGPSGCGKTTALNVLAGQVEPVSGQVRLAGEPVKGMLPSVGYISQADANEALADDVYSRIAAAQEVEKEQKILTKRKFAKVFLYILGMSSLLYLLRILFVK